MGQPHNKIGFAYCQIESAPAVWVIDEYAALTQRPHIIASCEDNVEEERVSTEAQHSAICRVHLICGTNELSSVTISSVWSGTRSQKKRNFHFLGYQGDR